MNKEELVKEMESVVRDILNPCNDRDPDVEAWLIIEDGWTKQQEAKWIELKGKISGNTVGYECSACGLSNPGIFGNTNYCPHCGAKMHKED